MRTVLNAVSTAFPFFEVSTKTRPGGDLLLTLKSEHGEEIKRSIPFNQYQTAEQVQWIVASIKRDLALNAGLTPNIEHLHYRTREPLPTYLDVVTQETTKRRRTLMAKPSTRTAAQLR